MCQPAQSGAAPGQQPSQVSRGVGCPALGHASLPNPSLTSSTSDRKGSRKPKKSRVCTGWLLIMGPHSSLGQLTAADSTRRSIFFDRISLTAIG
jgi:hypothetical protein